MRVPRGVNVNGFFTTTLLWVGVRYCFEGVRLGVLEGVETGVNLVFLLGVRGSAAELSLAGLY